MESSQAQNKQYIKYYNITIRQQESEQVTLKFEGKQTTK